MLVLLQMFYRLISCSMPKVGIYMRASQQKTGAYYLSLFPCLAIFVTVCAVCSLTRHLRGNFLVYIFISLMTLGGHVG